MIHSVESKAIIGFHPSRVAGSINSELDIFRLDWTNLPNRGVMPSAGHSSEAENGVVP